MQGTGRVIDIFKKFSVVKDQHQNHCSCSFSQYTLSLPLGVFWCFHGIEKVETTGLTPSQTNFPFPYLWQLEKTRDFDVLRGNRIKTLVLFGLSRGSIVSRGFIHLVCTQNFPKKLTFLVPARNFFHKFSWVHSWILCLYYSICIQWVCKTSTSFMDWLAQIKRWKRIQMVR